MSDEISINDPEYQLMVNEKMKANLENDFEEIGQFIKTLSKKFGEFRFTTLKTSQAQELERVFSSLDIIDREAKKIKAVVLEKKLTANQNYIEEMALLKRELKAHRHHINILDILYTRWVPAKKVNNKAKYIFIGAMILVSVVSFLVGKQL